MLKFSFDDPCWYYVVWKLGDLLCSRFFFFSFYEKFVELLFLYEISSTVDESKIFCQKSYAFQFLSSPSACRTSRASKNRDSVINGTDEFINYVELVVTLVFLFDGCFDECFSNFLLNFLTNVLTNFLANFLTDFLTNFLKICFDRFFKKIILTIFWQIFWPVIF